MPKRIALIVSNGRYQDKTLARFGRPPADVGLLASILGDPSISDFDEVDVIVDQPADVVRRHIRDLFRRRQRYDLLLLYFAGHALLDEDRQLHLAAIDTAPDLLEETAVPAAYVTDWMDRSFSRRQILILDGYYGQVLAPGELCLPVDSTSMAAAFKGKGYWRTILSASDAIHYTLAGNEVRGDRESSFFTHCLIHGLQTGAADLDNDGLICVDELHAYIRDQAVAQTTGEKPHLWRYGECDDLIIGSNASKFEQPQPVKWDLVFGAVMAPTATLVIGGPADLTYSIFMAVFFFLSYAFLYRFLD